MALVGVCNNRGTKLVNFLTVNMLFEKAVATSFITFEQKHQFFLEMSEMCSSLSLTVTYKLQLNLIFPNTNFFSK